MLGVDEAGVVPAVADRNVPLTADARLARPLRLWEGLEARTDPTCDIHAQGGPGHLGQAEEDHHHHVGLHPDPLHLY